jgi:PAS domain S-box-containing protein
MREEIQRILTNPHLTFLSNTSSILDASVNTLQQHLLLATLLLSFFVAPLIGWLIKRQFEPLQLVCSELSKQMAINQIAIQRPEIQDEISNFIAGFNQFLDTSLKKDNLINESHYRAKYAIEGTGDGLWDWNIEDNTVFFSPRWKEMLGFSEDEVDSGLHEWESRIHPEDKPTVMADVQAYLDGNKAFYNNEHRVRCKDGGYKWILDRGMVVNRSPDGSPLRMIGTHIDISQSKQTENDLLEQKRFLYDSQTIAKVGSWMLNIEIGKISWSDETFKIFGLSPKTDLLCSQ